MSKIKIKNFGPIKEGCLENDGWMDVKKVTVFIGNQGSGKSVVAKLISTFTWIEKALVRGDLNVEDLTVDNSFKDHCAYQNIGNYFKDASRVEYSGKAYSMLYENGNILVKKKEKNGYFFPKIMYVPAERNFVSSVTNVYKLKGLPSTLYTFSDEDINAKEDLKCPLLLPINNAIFEYRKPVSLIRGDNYSVKLTEASSGFQSFVPLFIVSRFLALSINKEGDSSVKEISIEEEKRIKEEIEEIYSNPNLSEEVKKASLEYLSSRFKYACFINIVEEPEQNLFPNSQRRILNSLLEFANMNMGNKLVITTHSPYLINFLSIAVQGNELYKKIEEKGQWEKLKEEFEKIVPKKSTVSASDLIIYQLNEIDGTIRELPKFEDTIPSDNNYLNNFIAKGNKLFDELLEMEQGL